MFLRGWDLSTGGARVIPVSNCAELGSAQRSYSCHQRPAVTAPCVLQASAIGHHFTLREVFEVDARLLLQIPRERSVASRVEAAA
jgi:hypothetical protein